jgi:hypothetical protein
MIPMSRAESLGVRESTDVVFVFVKAAMNKFSHSALQCAPNHRKTLRPAAALCEE